MTNYARSIESGLQIGLPSVGELKDGRHVSGYNNLDHDILIEEGWLPLIEDSPTFDDTREYLLGPEYEVGSSQIVAHYTVASLPASFTVDRSVIPADGTTIAVATYFNPALNAPANVSVTANGVSVNAPLVDAYAHVDITAAQVGPIDIIVDALPEVVLTIMAEEVPGG